MQGGHSSPRLSSPCLALPLPNSRSRQVCEEGRETDLPAAHYTMASLKIERESEGGAAPGEGDQRGPAPGKRAGGDYFKSSNHCGMHQYSRVF